MLSTSLQETISFICKTHNIGKYLKLKMFESYLTKSRYYFSLFELAIYAEEIDETAMKISSKNYTVYLIYIF